MKKEIERIYRERDLRKKRLLSLKNRYFAIVYSQTLSGVSVRKIHKALYDETVNAGKYGSKALFAMAVKASNRANRLRGSENLADLLLALIMRTMDPIARHIATQEALRKAEEDKLAEVEAEIQDNRNKGKWFYLASSHDDCAKDHKDWQGKLYVDDKAPAEVIAYAKARGLYTLQWVMDRPVWFVTRPNCRHYFVALTEDQVRKPLKKLKKRYRTHFKEGDRSFQTPPRRAVEEYEDRLRMLRGLYRERPTERLKKEIQKCELLVRKWKNLL